MRGSRDSIRFIVFVLGAVSSLVGAAADEKSDLASIERRLRAKYETVAPATVAIEGREDDRGRFLSSGVIATSDGYVLTVTAPCPSLVPLAPRQGESVAVILDGGRRVSGTVVGFSMEWKIALLKITEKGPWPCVRLARDGEIKAGQVCVALG